MEKYYNQIKNSPVFLGLSEEELKQMLECFNARIKTYQDGEFIINQGDFIKNIYLVLDGNVNIEKDIDIREIAYNLCLEEVPGFESFDKNRNGRRIY